MRRSAGFTLIELLISITILAILASTGYVMFDHANKKARDGRRKNDLQTLRTTIDLYYQTYNTIPQQHIDSQNINWNTLFAENGDNPKRFIDHMPNDPRLGQTDDRTGHTMEYVYEPISNRAYWLCATMELAENEQPIAAPSQCSDHLYREKYP